MKGYKAFQKGMICRGKQYAENTVYEEQGADSCCKEGVMHYCETPFDVWNYYPVVDDNGDFTEYAEVEPLSEVQRDGDKCATKKMRIGTKLSLKDFIKAQIDAVTRKPEMPKDYVSSSDGNQLASSSDGSQLASSGNWSQLASSGNGNRLASSGNWSQLASSGDRSRLASSSDGSQLASSGNWSQLASSGDGSRLASSGDGSRLASSGDESRLASSGDWSKLAVMGSNSIGASVGFNSKAKGIIGNWIVLAEWKNKDGAMCPVCVKAAKIDGEIIKADTWYTLKNGEFVEAI